jgi:hypothetical protein
MNTKTIYTNRYATVSLLESGNVLICKAEKEFIPADEFKAIFTEIGKYIRSNSTPIHTLIFDKTALRTFDQTSMTWYHVSWKPTMKSFGLRFHKKILPPNDALFQKSVEIGRGRIQREHPNFNFEDYNISYHASVEEAVAAAEKEVVS